MDCINIIFSQTNSVFFHKQYGCLLSVQLIVLVFCIFPQIVVIWLPSRVQWIVSVFCIFLQIVWLPSKCSIDSIFPQIVVIWWPSKSSIVFCIFLQIVWLPSKCSVDCIFPQIVVIWWPSKSSMDCISILYLPTNSTVAFYSSTDGISSIFGQTNCIPIIWIVLILIVTYVSWIPATFLILTSCLIYTNKPW